MSKKVDISIIFPTRKRVEPCIFSLQNAFDLADEPDRIEVLLGVDDDDEKTYNSLMEFIKKSGFNVKIHRFERKSWVSFPDYLNELVKHTKGNWVWPYSDDVIMEEVSKGWDSYIRKHDGRFVVLSPWCPNNHRVKKSKKLQKSHSYNPIVTKKWCEILGMFGPDPANDVWVEMVSKELGIFHMAGEKDHAEGEGITIFSRRYKDSGDKSMKDQLYAEVQQRRRKWKIGMRKKKGSTTVAERTKGTRKDAVRKIKAYFEKKAKNK